MALNKSYSSASQRTLPQWQLEFESAMRETNHRTLFRRIEIAEAAILTRREILTRSQDGFVERKEIETALGKLNVLKKDVLKFS